MEKGTFVAFTAKGSRKFGLVEGPEGKLHLKVVDAGGKGFTVHPKEIEFSSGAYKADRKTLPLAQLPTFLTKSHELVDTVDLAGAWELYAGETPEIRLEDLTSLLFSENTLEGLLAVFLALENDRLYFKRKNETWEVRTAAQVEEGKKQASALQAKASAQEGLKSRLEARLADPEAPLAPEDLKKLESVKKYALWEEEAPEKSLSAEVLTVMGRPKTALGALGLLTDLGVWSVHENLDFHRAGLARDFPADVLERAEALAAPSPLDPWKDLREQVVYTVDEASTTEIDDGFSVNWLSDTEAELWIHIADPSRLIQPGDPVDLEARRRGSTLYLPEGKVTMIPEVLAEGPFSLREGVETSALSFRARLGSDGALLESDIQRTRIKPTKRLTYQTAQDLMDENANRDWVQLEAWSRSRKEWRLSQGAIDIQFPEMDLQVSEGGAEVRITEYPAYRSRDLVTEMMVLAGEIAGRFCRDHRLPVAYRGQTLTNRPDPQALAVLPEGPVREAAKFPFMTRSVFSTEPLAHQGLGLEVYVQATSPIRRYLDLWTHYQILSFLGIGAASAAPEDLAQLLPGQEAAQSQSVKLERAADKYWTQEFFRRQKKGQTWKGLVLDYFRREELVASVLMEGTALRLNVKLSQEAAIGETISFKVVAADPRKDLLNLGEG